MAFIKTESYWQNKIKNIRRAIAATEKALEAEILGGETRRIQAQESYLESCKKELEKTTKQFNEWALKQC
jgi:hypothetical protein